MSLPVEAALKIAILSNPEYFGLRMEEVNPLLMFSLLLEQGEDEDSAELVASCFDTCNSSLYAKLTEVFKTDLDTKPGQAQPNPPQPAGNSSGNKRSPKHQKPEPAGPGISVKQLRYIGYLLNKLGESPDYKEIQKLSQKQATGRIRELEQQVGV